MQHKAYPLWTVLCLFMALAWTLTGCGDSRDPEDRAYIITLGVEKTPSGCLFTFAPADTGMGKTLFSVESDTLSAAVAKAESRSSREVYLGQLKNIICSKTLLEDKKAFGSLLDELERSIRISEKVMLLGTEESAAKCVDAIAKADSSTGLFLWEFYKNTAEEVAVTRHMDLDTWLTDLRMQNQSGILPALSLEEEQIVLGGGIALSEGAYDFTLLPLEEQDCLLLTGEGKGAVLTETQNGMPMTAEIRKNHVTYDFWQDNGKTFGNIHVFLQGALTGSSGEIVSDGEKRRKAEELFATRIKSHLENTIKVVQQKAKGDVLGLQAAAERKLDRPLQSGQPQMTVSCTFSLIDTGRIR